MMSLESGIESSSHAWLRRHRSNSFYESCEPPKITEPDEVIVKLKAAAINHIDIWNRIGATGMVVAMPHILGADGAGVVAEAGAKVEQRQSGRRCLSLSSDRLWAV